MTVAGRSLAGRAAHASSRRIAALLAGTALVAAGIWQLPTSVRSLNNDAAVYANQTAQERSLHAATGESIDPAILLAARRTIPPAATYAVATGPGAHDEGTNTLAAIAPFAGYWLLPRTQLPVGGSVVPDWVLSYGADLGSLGYRYRRVVRVAPGLALAEVAR